MDAGMPSPQQQMGSDLLRLCRELTAESGPSVEGFKPEVMGKIGEERGVQISRRIGDIFFITVRGLGGPEDTAIIRPKGGKDGKSLETVPQNVERVRDAVRLLRDSLAGQDGA
jgi:hypothetical protein